ncbi:major capsid protein [Tsukamurella spumae]|uniref:Capsid protein n=1 Tax=Tsukamurella spumae TaxID=44753 RepID=A0A846X2W8_9ACTN|nr:major capsid protein [Tsukamurella spumae]NKY18865.1 hypothetical protein [Tsukamurella spumae]
MEPYVDQQLTTMSQLWKNEDDSLIIPKLLPRVSVKKDSGVFPIWGKEALVIQQDLSRTGRSLTREINLTRHTDVWGPLTEKALKIWVDKDQYSQYDSPFETESAALLVLKEQTALAEEYSGAKILTDPNIITNNITLTSGSKFTVSGVDPIATLIDALKQFRKAAFKLPNTMAIGYDAWLALINHPAVIERFKYVQASIIGKDEILRVLAPYGIQSIEIAKAQGFLGDTENPDVAPTAVDLWGDNVLFTYITPRPELMSVNGGYTLVKDGYNYVDKWEERDPKGHFVRDNDKYAQTIFSTDVYYLIADVL